MSSTEGAPPTQRCPRCIRHLEEASFSTSSWRKSGAYCRTCASADYRARRAGPRYFKIVPADELTRLRAQVACLVCGAVPTPNGRGRVATKHVKGCTAVDERLRDTG